MVDRYLTGSQAMLCVRSVCARVFVCVRASVRVFVCGSTLTPLRGGLARNSMETLSESVSVRKGEGEENAAGENWGEGEGGEEQMG